MKFAPTDLSGFEHGVELLGRYGLVNGSEIRFRLSDVTKWCHGSVVCVDHDGSIGLIDARGRRRSIASCNVEKRVNGPRGGTSWVGLIEEGL